MNEQVWIDYLQKRARDLRVVLETLHEMEPWVAREDFKQEFTENDLGELYDDVFEPEEG